MSRRIVRFVNLAHSLDHFVLLIFPTAVIAMAAQEGLDYAQLITLSTGAFVAFGLFSLPMGWIADRVGRRNMLAAFFLGYGASCSLVAESATSTQLAVSLVVLGIFSAIYHPIGSTLLVSHARVLGRELGWNGVWGNLGAALASGVTALIAAQLGWRWAFIIPGIVCAVSGIAFLLLVPSEARRVVPPSSKMSAAQHAATRPAVLLALFGVAIVAGGMTFNITSIALPKVIDEGAGTSLPLALTGALATAVFIGGAATQLLIGRLIDKVALPVLFAGLSCLQPLGLGLAACTNGVPMLAGLMMAMAAIYGQVVINDAMIARYVPPASRAKAFSIRYFLGFTASGFAAPLIGVLHRGGGFAAVLGVAAAFGGVVVVSAWAFRWLLAAAPVGDDATAVPPAVA